MGWGYGQNEQGREIGYNVIATCDHPGCTAEIDRGVFYVCGGDHGGGEFGCGGYFCSDHQRLPNDVFLCFACAAEYEKNHPEEAAA